MRVILQLAGSKALRKRRAGKGDWALCGGMTLLVALAPAWAGQPQPPTIVVLHGVLSDNGDGDGWADTNETVTMRIAVRNRYPFDLTNLVARLATEDSKIACVSRPDLPIGSLPAGATTLTRDGFTFLVADVDRPSTATEFSVTFRIAMSADQFASAFAQQELTLDLDLDVGSGGGPTTFFEGFEQGFGAFTTMHLDESLNPPADDLNNHAAGLVNADGSRCQYTDPDWQNSNSYLYGTPFWNDRCYPNPPGIPDRFWWTTTSDRAFSGTRSLYWGLFLDPVLGFTTPFAQLEAVRTTEAINLAWQPMCSGTHTMSCDQNDDCPPFEVCRRAAPELRFKHQVSFLDHRSFSAPGHLGNDRGAVHVQLLDGVGMASGDWIKVYPYYNVYDTPSKHNLSNCFFDPTDDGNTEDDFFDPTDPLRRLGPSSTCFPEYTFMDQGNTGPFDPDDIGDASDGPGLAGETGAGTWVEARVDLARFRGRRLRVRFLHAGFRINGTWVTYESAYHRNPTPRDDGWFIDDVTVTDTLAVPATVSLDTSANTDIKGDGDFDGIGATCDCAPEDAELWALPGEVPALTLTHVGGATGTTTLSWLPPADVGNTAVTYDTLRSTIAADFSQAPFAQCVAADDPLLSHTDGLTPPAGSAFFYLVRARHGCGAGSLGTGSSGAERVAIDCQAVAQSTTRATASG